MKRLALAFAVVLTAVVPVLAASEDDLVDAINAAKASTDPTTTFFRKLMAMNDVQLNGAQVKSALERAGIGTENAILTGVLGNVTSIRKVGENVTLKSSQRSAIPLGQPGEEPQGFLRMDKEVKFRVHQDGREIVVDDFSGLYVSKERDSTRASFRKIRLLRENGQQVMKVTAGVAIFTQTKTIVLPANQPAPAGDTPGITNRVPGQ